MQHWAERMQPRPGGVGGGGYQERAQLWPLPGLSWEGTKGRSFGQRGRDQGAQLWPAGKGPRGEGAQLWPAGKGPRGEGAQLWPWKRDKGWEGHSQDWEESWGVEDQLLR
eukprot:196938-Chlamydomonas_euryale.AAC.2